MQLSANNTYTVPEGFTARITLEAVKSTIAVGWNPDGLYHQTVGTEYRLLTPEEHKFFLQNLDADRSGVEMYSMGTWVNCSVDSPYKTYRVPLSWVHPSKRSPLAKGRNLHNLTEAQVEVEEGWRLITEKELDCIPLDAEYWNYNEKEFLLASSRGVPANPSDRRDTDYRTKVPLPLTPEQILSNWIATYDVKVGDLVRVTGKEKATPWVCGMDDQIGKVQEISLIGERTLTVGDDWGYCYSPLDLEKVTERQVPLEKEDWEGEWYIRSSDGLRIYKVTSTSSMIPSLMVANAPATSKIGPPAPKPPISQHHQIQ
jgi:hypothetical protein